MTSAATIPQWKVSGDWFDVCKCAIPCPCTFAQTPTYGDCEGVLAYHINKGNYGNTSLDGLNVLGITYFKGNIWAGETKFTGAFFLDERADQQQRDALQRIFTGKARGFMAEFAKLWETCEELTMLQLGLKWQMTFPIGAQRFQER
jgi:hypothetical protein